VTGQEDPDFSIVLGRCLGSLWDRTASHRALVAVLLVGAILWASVFVAGMNSFSGTRPFRSSWNGEGTVTIFGWILSYDWEGWSDYDYYYVTWGLDLLSGGTLYTPEFSTVDLGGSTGNAPYFFPPLFAYLCAMGMLLPIRPFGIGLLITLFGYLTALPIYGIIHRLTDDAGTAALGALSYLFNPLVLYHTAFQWLNPAPFTFFALLGLFLLMTDHKTLGTLSVVVSAMFKQTGFFMVIPLLAYAGRPSRNGSQDGRVDDKAGSTSALDTRSIEKTVLLGVSLAFLLSLPYILIDPLNYLYYIFVKPGVVWIDPSGGIPSRQVPTTVVFPLIALRAPHWVILLFDILAYYGIAAIAVIVTVLVVQLVHVTQDWSEPGFSQRSLSLVAVLYFWVYFWSPRGIYKYYCVTLLALLVVWCSIDALRPMRLRGHKFRAGFVLSTLLWGLLILYLPRWLYIVVIGATALMMSWKELLFLGSTLAARVHRVLNTPGHDIQD